MKQLLIVAMMLFSLSLYAGNTKIDKLMEQSKPIKPDGSMTILRHKYAKIFYWMEDKTLCTVTVIKNSSSEVFCVDVK